MTASFASILPHCIAKLNEPRLNLTQAVNNEGFMYKIPFWTELCEAAFVIIAAILVAYLARLMLGAMLSTPGTAG